MSGDPDSPTPVETMQRAAADYFASDPPERPFGPPPDMDALQGAWFDEECPDQYEPLERYWVNKPYVFVVICRDTDVESNRYRIVEPTLEADERRIRSDLHDLVRRVLREYDPVELERRSQVVDAIEEVLATYGGSLPSESRYKLFYYLKRDYVGYDRVDPLMHDANIEDISCDGPDRPVFVYHDEYADLQTDLTFEASALESLVLQLAERAQRQLSAARPKTSGTLPDGSRVQLTIDSDITAYGSNFTIWRFSEEPFTPVDLVQLNTFSLDEMAFIWLALEHNQSIMFTGPTASGKTTSMNAASLFLPPDQKVISIERVRELSIPHKNWLSYVTRETSTGARQDISMYDLLQSVLHERPQYILVGEIRTDPMVARTFFQSIYTGHSGGTTFHADSADNAINRLTGDPIALDERMIPALDIIVVQKRRSLGEDKLVRRAVSISELRDSETGPRPTLGRLFEWDPETDAKHRTLDRYSDSVVLQEIATTNGWDEQTLLDELAKRREVLAFLIETGRTEYQDVVKFFYRFHRNEPRVIEQIRSDDARA